MKMIREWKLLSSRKKKSNRDGKICAEFRALRKRARRFMKQFDIDEIHP